VKRCRLSGRQIEDNPQIFPAFRFQREHRAAIRRAVHTRSLRFGPWEMVDPKGERNMQKPALAIASSILLAAALFAAAPVVHAAVPAIPTVEGPITGPGPMHPGMRLGPDGTNPDDFDYVAEEFFVSGFAAGAPYKVRVLVRRPDKPHKFSGTVVYEPTHRGGNALIFQFARFGILQHGHIGVTVGARPINLNNPTTPQAGLQVFNPARYGSLQVAANQTNEILA
jgi:hypothetical protein